MFTLKNTRIAVMLIASVMGAGSLEGCASAVTRDRVTSLDLACKSGRTGACAELPAAQAQESHEAQENAGKVALGVILIPLLVLAVAAGASMQPPTEVIVVRPRRW